MLQAKEATNEAVDICRKVGKPCESDRKLLSKLYPTCTSRSLPQKPKFDPIEESVAEKKRQKKKAAISRGGKARSITAVLLKHPLSMVPKGGARKQLANEGCIRKMQIRCSMTPSEVKQVIANCFSTLKSANGANFMKCNRDNSLSILENQTLNGDETAEVAGGGSLYLTEVITFIIVLCLQIHISVMSRIAIDCLKGIWDSFYPCG